MAVEDYRGLSRSEIIDELERARSLLERFEWSYDDQYCPICRANQLDHEPDCELAIYLGRPFMRRRPTVATSD